eukprot:5640015-Lingulodinium_polyedra.AAC.1
MSVPYRTAASVHVWHAVLWASAFPVASSAAGLSSDAATPSVPIWLPPPSIEGPPGTESVPCGAS